MKAFDSVPREALFAVLRRYGMPDHFVKVLIRLHYGAQIKVKIGEVDSEIDSTIGVRQGSCEGPVLFLFIMQAAMETLEWPDGVSKPEFMTREYGKITGERSSRVRDASSFELWASLFAGDFVLLFQSRDEIIRGSSHIFAHLRKFGLCMRMLVAVTQHSKLRQCTFRRRERRMRQRTRLAFTLMAPASLLSVRSSST